MSFAVADDDENSDLFYQFGFDESSEEVNVGILGPDNLKYPMEPMDEFESDEVENFLKSFMKGVFHCVSKNVSTVCFALCLSNMNSYEHNWQLLTQKSSNV